MLNSLGLVCWGVVAVWREQTMGASYVLQDIILDKEEADLEILVSSSYGTINIF